MSPLFLTEVIIICYETKNMGDLVVVKEMVSVTLSLLVLGI